MSKKWTERLKEGVGVKTDEIRTEIVLTKASL